MSAAPVSKTFTPVFESLPPQVSLPEPAHKPTEPTTEAEVRALLGNVDLKFVELTPEEKEMKREMEIAEKAGHERVGDYVVGLNNVEETVALAKKTFLEFKIFKNEGCHFFESCGGQAYMQDCVFSDKIRDPHSEMTIEFFAALDGHGPQSTFLIRDIKVCFKNLFQRCLPPKPFPEITATEMKKAISEAYSKLNSKFIMIQYGGTTFSLGVKKGKELYVANVGDSRILLLKGDRTFVQCTEDAKVGINECTRFAMEIVKRSKTHAKWLFDTIKTWKGTEMQLLSEDTSAVIAMATTLGDFIYPQAIREPVITGPYYPQPGDRLFGASDGVFDLMDSTGVNAYCTTKTSEQIAEELGFLSMGVAYCTYSDKHKKRDKAQVDNTSFFITEPFK